MVADLLSFLVFNSVYTHFVRNYAVLLVFSSKLMRKEWYQHVECSEKQLVYSKDASLGLLFAYATDDVKTKPLFYEHMWL